MKQLKRIMAFMLAVVMAVTTVIPNSAIIYASDMAEPVTEAQEESGQDSSEGVSGNTMEETTEIESDDVSTEELKLYDATERTDLEDDEIVTADDLNVAVDSKFDVENIADGIHFNEQKVIVSYYADKGDFNIHKAGTYETYYRIDVLSGKLSYLICRKVKVEKDTSAIERESSNAGEDKDKADSDDDEPDGADSSDLVGNKADFKKYPLSEGEIENIKSNDATITIRLDDDGSMEYIIDSDDVESSDDNETGGTVSMVKDVFSMAFNRLFPAMVVQAADDESMKVSYSGYAQYCGHSMGIKYISESGDYYHHLVFCLDLNKNSTNGTVKLSSSKIKPQITYCLVNGARTLGGTCHNSKYSSGSADADYFITSAAIHVLNGEVSLSYYDNGSGVYKNIKELVEDAKNYDKTKYTSNGTTKSVTYTLTPVQSDWKEVEDGLYRSTDKFVRTKSGTIKDITYTISGVPDGLKSGEVKTDSSSIDDPADLKKFDVCVAQTDASKASSNFYVYCNEEAYKKIVAAKATIKITAKATVAEKGGRKWSPTVVSQQKITFLEDDLIVKSASATVKITSNYERGSFSLQKTNVFNPALTVPGATYALFEDAECDELLAELAATDGNGLAGTGIEVLTQDTYYLKEITAPDGYYLDETVYPIEKKYFTLYDASGNVTQQGEVYPASETPEPVGVIIHKKDGISQAEIQTAGFAVFTDAACTNRVTYDGMPNTEQVPVFRYDADLGGAASYKFDKKQDVYYVKEVEIPEGYSENGTTWEVRPNYGEFAFLDVPNYPIKCSVDCVKEDKETKVPQGDARLDGAVYGLYAAEDIKYPDGSGIVTYNANVPITSSKGNNFKMLNVAATKGALLATVETDKEYKFNFGNLYFGNYYVQEISSSEGYKIDPTAYPVNFRSAQNTHVDISLSCTVKEGVDKQPFEIIKISTNGKSEEVDLVQGAEFTVKLVSEIDKVGWDNAKVYDKLVTDEKGHARSKELPYGTYLVKETNVPEELYKTEDFTVKVNTDSREPQVWKTLNDGPFEAYIRFIKKDKETGKIVRLSGTTFKIRKKGAEDFITQKVGDKKISEFITDETGTITTPLKLKYGYYEVCEIKAPNGYTVHTEAVPFHVTKEGAVQVLTDEDGEAVIEVEIDNQSVKGSVSILKKGEVLAGAEYETIVDRILTSITGDNRSVTFKYEEQALNGAVYNLVADEDIYTADNQLENKSELEDDSSTSSETVDNETDENVGNDTESNTDNDVSAAGDEAESPVSETAENIEKRQIAVFDGVPLYKGAVAATLTTDKEGKADVSGLPLGKYHLEEVTAPEGFVLSKETREVELTYADQNTEVVYVNESFTDERVKTALNVHKVNAATRNAVQGATYGVYCVEDICSVDGDVIAEANCLVDTAVTDEEGKAVFDADLPLGMYYMKEIETVPGYLLDENEYEGDFTYKEPLEAVITEDVEVEEKPIIVEVSKSDITTGNELIGASLEIINSSGEVYASWVTDGNPYTLNAIPAGTYTLRETSAPYGYMVANEVVFDVLETGDIQKVAMVDERVKGYIEIFKTDSETKKAIKGVTFELRGSDGKVIETLKTDKDGYARSQDLDICTYKENGEFDRNIEYTVVETKAAKGYILDKKENKVVLEYTGNVKSSIPYELKLTNKPKEPKLPQTGGNYHAWMFILLGGLIFIVGLHSIRKRKG